MLNVLVTFHLLIAIVLVGLILLQKSEGGAGAGFSPSASVESMMRPRARPNPIGRATAVLGIMFFITSLGLALLTKPNAHAPRSIMAEPVTGKPAVPTVDDRPAVPSVPTEGAPAPRVPTEGAPAPAAPKP
jgi:preprotein translocase subunit SecG